MNPVQNTYADDQIEMRPTHSKMLAALVFAICYGCLVLAIVASGLLLG